MWLARILAEGLHWNGRRYKERQAIAACCKCRLLGVGPSIMRGRPKALKLSAREINIFYMVISITPTPTLLKIVSNVNTLMIGNAIWHIYILVLSFHSALLLFWGFYLFVYFFPSLWQSWLLELIDPNLQFKYYWPVRLQPFPGRDLGILCLEISIILGDAQSARQGC